MSLSPNLSPKLLVTLVSGLAAVGIAATAAMSAHADEPAPVGVGPGMTTPSFPAVTGASPAAVLSDATLHELAEIHHVIATPVDAGSASTTIDAQEAEISATSQFHFLNDGGRVSEVALARVTTTKQGTEDADGTIEPDLDRRVVWVVVFEHVRVRVGGGPQILDSEGQPLPHPLNVDNNAVMAVYVDPETGKVFGAAQW